MGVISKRFTRKRIYVLPLDLHGVKHEDVIKLVENYILLNHKACPLKIITGNSDRMKIIVKNTLKSHGFQYSEGDYYNRGYITVLN